MEYFERTEILFSLVGLIGVILVVLCWRLARTKQLLSEATTKNDQTSNTALSKVQIKALFAKLYEARQQKNVDGLKGYVSEGFLQQMSQLFARWEQKKYGYQLDKQKLLDAKLVSGFNYQYPDRDLIWVIVNSRMVSYLYHEPTGRLVEGDKLLKPNNEIWLFSQEQDQWILDTIIKDSPFFDLDPQKAAS
ncbi:hypothetical protein [Spartinivicinus poritis]|uniref:Tim44-like domain-containing protein n=1 Tax=Spartinivicinus poritis TaxID=2994640 RepID=A0ABT5UFV1_9GAMM|nr:hypothetical protein [Spartinivicinus sp. A2-2]MDE1464382.1 hypothetical protein [Spartinivicinus sp. A2-2]